MKRSVRFLLLSILFFVFCNSTVYSNVPEGWGKGWSEVSILGTASQDSPAPRVLQDSKGVFHIFWLDNLDGQDFIHYRQMTDEGTTINDKTIYQVKGWETRNFVAMMDVTDTIYIFSEAVNNGEFEVKYYEAATGEWKTLLDLERPLQGLTGKFDTEGNLHFLWGDMRLSNYEIFYSKYSPELQQIVAPKPLTNTPGISVTPALALDSKGQVHLVWTEYDGIIWTAKYQIISATGQTVSGILDIGRTYEYQSNTSPQIGIDSKDRVYIVWAQINRGGFGTKNYDLYYTIFDASQNRLFNEMAVSDHGRKFSMAISPMMLIDKNDVVHLVWSDNLSSSLGDFYATFKGTSILEPQMRLAVVAENMWLPTIGLDAKGRVHLFTMQFDQGGRYNLAYMNTVKPAKVSYLTRIGLDVAHPLSSAVYRAVHNIFFSALGIIMNFLPLAVAFGLILVLGIWFKQMHWYWKVIIMVSVIIAFTGTPFSMIPTGNSSLYDLLAISLSLILVYVFGKTVKLDFGESMTFVLLEVIWLFTYMFILLIPAGTALLR